jgi:hypothetical protein
MQRDKGRSKYTEICGGNAKMREGTGEDFTAVGNRLTHVSVL